jgi:hypothetical protein
MKTYGGAKEQLHAFLNSALDGDRQLHAPAALSPVPMERDWVSSRTGLDTVVPPGNQTPVDQSVV